MADSDMGAGASIGGGLGAFLGSLFGNSDAQGSDDAKKQYLMNLLKLNTTAEQAGPSALATADPATRGAQLDVLGQLQKVASSGFTPQDQAAINQTLNQTGTAERGSREAILNGMNARGMGGSGNELLAQLTSQQAGYDRANQAGTDLAAQGRQRQLDAMSKAGSLAGDVRSQDYQAAGATDAINRFNALNRQGTQQFNAGLQQTGDEAMGGFYGDEAARKRRFATGTGQALGGAIGAGAGLAAGGG